MQLEKILLCYITGTCFCNTTLLKLFLVTKLDPGKISDTPNDAGLTSKHETENTSPEDNIGM